MNPLQTTLDNFINEIKTNGTVNYGAVARLLKEVLNAPEIDAKTIVERTGDLDASLDYRYSVPLGNEPEKFKLPEGAIHYSPLSYLLCTLTEEQLETHLPELVDQLDDATTKKIFLNGEHVQTSFAYITPTEASPVLTTYETQTIYKSVDLLAKLSKVGCVKELIQGERNVDLKQREIQYEQQAKLDNKNEIWVVTPLNSSGVKIDGDVAVLEKANLQRRLMKLHRLLQTTTNTNRVHVIGEHAVVAPVLQAVKIVAKEYEKEGNGDDFEQKLNERLAQIYQAYNEEKQTIKGDTAKRLLALRKCITAVDEMVKKDYNAQDQARVFALLNTAAGSKEYYYIKLMKSVVSAAVLDTSGQENIVEKIDDFESLSNALMYKEIQQISHEYKTYNLDVFIKMSPRTLDQLQHMQRVATMVTNFMHSLTFLQYDTVKDWLCSANQASTPLANLLSILELTQASRVLLRILKNDKRDSDILSALRSKTEEQVNNKEVCPKLLSGVNFAIELHQIASEYTEKKASRTIGKSGNPFQTGASALEADRLKLKLFKLLRESKEKHGLTLFKHLHWAGSRDVWTYRPGVNNWESDIAMTVLVSLLCHQKNALSKGIKYPESYQIIRDVALGRAGANERFEDYIARKDRELNPPAPQQYTAEVHAAVAMHLARR